MDKMKTEPFQTPQPSLQTQQPINLEDNSINPKYQPPPKPKVNYIYTRYDYELQTKEKGMFCDDEVDMYSRVSMNQKLAGKPNPKTLIPPVSVAPPMDPSWKATNMTIDFKGHVQREPALDLYQSGYKSFDEIENRESYQSNNSTYSSNVKKTQYEHHLNNTEDDNSFYNRNINLQTIQPGVYFKNEGKEPISSNIGITETKKSIHPIKTMSDNGDIYYNEYNNNAKFKKEYIERNPGPEDIYDPRFTGYGTSYRSYFDEFVGQPRFYYDDVDAMRMPNYLVRSKIDHLDFADQYGPMSDEYMNKNEYIREMTNQSFLDNSLSFRNELQERLMRKRNSEMAYIRQFPKRTSGQRMMGGLGFRG